MVWCENFRVRIYGDFEVILIKFFILEIYFKSLRFICLLVGGNNNVLVLDYVIFDFFDNFFYCILLNG